MSKRLEEIKNEIAKKHGFKNWKDLFLNGCRSEIVLISDKSAERYAREVAQASLERASENLKYKFILDSDEEFVLKESITNPDNIVL